MEHIKKFGKKTFHVAMREDVVVLFNTIIIIIIKNTSICKCIKNK